MPVRPDMDSIRVTSMSAGSNSLNNFILRPFPATLTHDTAHLTRLERLDIIIKNLEQNQQEVKDQIIREALAERDEIDKGSDPPTKVQKPNLAALRSKWRPSNKDEKPPRARISTKNLGDGLFVEQQSHVSLARETAAKLDAYAKGTPAALERFRAVRERILKEEQGGGTKEAGTAVGMGGTEAGNLSAQVDTKPQAPIVAATGYDASRDPRRRV